MSNESTLQLLEVVGQLESICPTSSLRFNPFCSLLGHASVIGFSIAGDNVAPSPRQPPMDKLRSKSVTLEVDSPAGEHS